MWTAAAAYDRFMGRWSRRVAALFLDALTVPAAGRCLDVGCGVGSLTAAIVEHCSPRAVVGVDTSAELLRYATKRTPAGTPVCYQRADAEDLPYHEAAFDAALSGLTLNFVSDPARALREMVRVTRSGGTVAAYVWDYQHPDFFLARFWAAARAVNGTSPPDERGRWALCSRAGLPELAEGSPLVDTRVWTIRIETRFSSPDELWGRIPARRGALRCLGGRPVPGPSQRAARPVRRESAGRR